VPGLVHHELTQQKEKRMKSVRIGGLAALAIAIAAVAWTTNKAWAAHCGGTTAKSCTENIRETKHNLALNTDILAAGTTEVCVFCHTPHGGQTNVAGGGAPLWNRALPPDPSQNAFITYDSPNFDRDIGSKTTYQPDGVSLACLSCHDGTIALDALINAPGSGGFTPANRGFMTGTQPGTSIPGINFTGVGVDSTSSLGEGDRQASPSGGGYNGGLNDFVGSSGMEPFPNLGRNLSDDHPISMRMPSTDLQFAEALAGSTTLSTGGNVRYVQRTGAQMPTDTRDRIRLYNTGGTSSGTTVDWVECASCHNPHTPRTTFLRLPSTPTGVDPPGIGEGFPVSPGNNLNHEPNQGSLICLTCHQK
jgi:hypothetical protein